MEKPIRWTDWQGNGTEHCHVSITPNGVVIEGVVAGTRGGLYGATYRVSTDEAFNTRRVGIAYVGGEVLDVEADGQGNWIDRIAMSALPELEGCLDVDIGVTPATNMLPVLRLSSQGFAEGESRDILAAYVPLPGEITERFVPRRAEQRYTCLKAGSLYRYEGLFRKFEAELAFDEDGIVLDYPDTFRRV